MPREYAVTEEAIVGIARYEVMCRAEEFTPVIKAAVHDALWFLTQQWRSGEFEGEDAASLIKAKIDTKSVFLNRFKSRNGSVEPFRHEIPLEAKVERLPLILDLGMQLEIGYMWRKILKNNGLLSLYPHYIDKFQIKDYASEPTDSLNVRYKSNVDSMQVRKATQFRLVNGGALFDHIYKDGKTVWQDVPNVSGSPQLTTAQTEFKTWLAQTYYWPADDDENSWSEQRLEYQFSMSAPDVGTPTQTVLVGEQYSNGELDWYSVDRATDPNQKLTEDPAHPISDSVLTEPYDNKAVVKAEEVYSYLPNTISFKGMPKGRWWEFEDRNIDVARMVTQRQDITRVVLMEFGLRYSNDYFIMPHKLDVGTMTEVRGLVVTDVFGQRFNIEEADKNISQVPEKKWDMYNNSRKGAVSDTSFKKMLLAPNLINRMESDPLEKVMFVRDEMSNMVWGIEEVVPDDLLTGMDGRKAANILVEYIGGSYTPIPDGNYVPNDATLRYKLINNTVPENWIPFIPSNPDPLYNLEKRAIKLQRAAMLRYVVDNDINVKIIRPRTSILSINLPDKPYYIFEEEISNSGFSLTTNYQRTRWYDGRTYVWLGRKRRTGKGEVGSGLLYDTLANKQPD